MVFAEFLSAEEKEITNILVSIICLYGNSGLPLENVEEEFMRFSGYSIPYKKFGCDNLRSYISTLPEIYIVTDPGNHEVLIQQSQKSSHIKELIMNQKNRYQAKRKASNPTPEYGHLMELKRKKNNSLSSFVHTSFDTTAVCDSDRFDKFEQLESMLPLFYKHQALGDDFFVDIADTKMGYYVPEKGPKECGLCSAGQTISKLTEKVKVAKHLAPRVVVMIGYQDLLWGQNVNTMISDLRQLVVELKKKNTRVTLITLIETPKMPKVKRLLMRKDTFNKAILDYACDNELRCNIIDMNTIFEKEAATFRRDFDRFKKIAKKDHYKVFSDYGRKIFLAALKSCLKEQIEAGH